MLRIRVVGAYVYRIRWVLLFGVVVFGARIHQGGLDGDSLVYALISRNLLHQANPLVLTLGGHPWLQKPPLLFWLTAASMRAFGDGMTGAQLVPVLAGIGIMILLFEAGSRVFRDEAAGLLAAAVFATSRTIVLNTQAVRLGSLLYLMVLLSMGLFVLYLQRRQWWQLALAGLAAGLAVMTKGPFGLLPVAAAGIYLLLFEREAIDGRLLRHAIPAVFLFLLSFGWWYGYVLVHTDFFRVFVQQQFLDRLGPVATQTHHFPVNSEWTWLSDVVQNYVYYLPFTALGLVVLWREHRQSRLLRLLLVFTALLWLGLLLVATKYARYLYPFYMVLSLPTAAGLMRLFRIDWQRFVRNAGIVLAVLVAVYPGRLHRMDYGVLARIARLAAHDRVPVVAGAGFHRGWGHWAMRYYAPGFRPEPPGSGRYMLVTRRPPTGVRPVLQLLDRSRVQVYLLPSGAPRGGAP